METHIVVTLNVNELKNLIESCVREVLKENPNPNAFQQQDVMTIREAAEYLHLTIPAIYAMVHRKAICYSKRGKRLFFNRRELSTWLENGRMLTTEEIRRSARGQLATVNK